MSRCCARGRTDGACGTEIQNQKSLSTGNKIRGRTIIRVESLRNIIQAEIDVELPLHNNIEVVTKKERRSDGDVWGY